MRTISGTSSPRARSSSPREKMAWGTSSMTIWPPFMTTTRSAMTASSMYWVIMITVMPFFRFSS